MKKFAKVLVVFLVVALAATIYPLMAAAAVDPVSAIAWALGFFSQQPKVFHITNFDVEIYTKISENDLVLVRKFYPNAQMKVGDKLYINPETLFAQFDGKGLLLRLLSERRWIAHFSIPQSRDTEVSSGSVVIYRGVEPKNEQEVQESDIVFKHNFRSNDFSFVLPSTTNDLAYSCSAFIQKPTRANGYGYFRYYSKPSAEYAREFDTSKVVGTIIYGSQMEDQKKDAEKFRTVGIVLQGRQEPDTSAAILSSPVQIVVQDKHGEVYRGPLTDNLELKVDPSGYRLFKGNGEIDLSTNPPCQSGCFMVTPGTANAVVVYPWRDKINIGQNNIRPEKLRGEVKVYARKGSQIPLEFSAVGEKGRTTASISSFGGKVISVWTDNPQQEMIVKAFLNGREYVQKITPNNLQAIFNFESISSVRNYSTINVNPAVRGGINSRDDLAHYAASDHFLKNLRATGVDQKEIEIFRQQALSKNVQFTAVGPDVKRFSGPNGLTFVSTNLIKSLTECGPNGQPVGHQTFYQTTFREYHRVWIPANRYGWVPGIITTCGNAVMIWVQPPTPSITVFSPPKLPEAPPVNIPELPNLFILGKSSGNIRTETVTPSSTAPLMATASTKIDVKQSQMQGQVANNVNNNTNSATATNTNVNNIPINVAVDVNTVNQNLNILNGANAGN